jgi:hypothetical protein
MTALRSEEKRIAAEGTAVIHRGNISASDNSKEKK